MIPAIVRVVLDEGEVKCVPLTPETTARDVIECCRDPDEPFCTLTQTTRDGERVLALHERPLLLIQGQQEVGERVTFVLRYDMTQDVREDTGSADDGMKGPQPASTQLPDGVELTLSELREMAGRQQQQIDDHQQQLVAKEQRLKYLKQQESRHQAMNSETERLRRLRERVEAQELKLRKLRALRGQSEQQRVNNNALSVDLENIRALFNEKEKELSLAVARVEEMTRQLEEVRRGRELRQGPQGDTHRELEKLRRELMYRNKLNEQQHSQLASQTETLGQRRDEMARIDQRIAELQQRLHRKRVHNQQLASQLHAASAAKRQVRQTSAKTLPAPAPLRTKDDMGSEPADFGLNKSDPKYQTLPYNTKFHMKEAGVPERQEEPEPAAAPPPGPRPAGPRAPPLGGTLSQGGPIPQTILPQPYGQRPPTQPPPARASGLPRPVAPNVSANTSSSARLQGGAAPPLPNNLHADPAEVNGERPLLPPKPASGPPPSKPTASRLNGEAAPEAPPAAGLTGDVSQVSVRGTQAKGPPHPYRYASRSQIASTYTNQHRPENGQLPQQQHQQEQQELINSYQQHLQQQQFQKQQQLQHQFQQQQQQQQQQQLQQHQQLQQQKQQQELQQQQRQQEEQQRLQQDQQASQDQQQQQSARKAAGDSSDDSPPVRVSINSRIAMPPAYMFPQLAPESSARAADPADGATDRNDNPVDEVDRAPAADRRLRLGQEQLTVLQQQQVKDQQVKEQQQKEQEAMDLDANLNPAENGSHMESSGDSSAADSPGSDGDGQPSVGPALRRRKASNLKAPGSVAKTNRVSFDPLALLLDASLEGELELVKKTAGEVRDPSASNDEGITALHNAICAGHFEIVKFLVEFGCDVNSQDSDGWTPLHCAASCNNLPMVSFLVEHGACIFATTLSDHETAAEKCEEDEEGYHGCSEYLYSIQEKLGILNSGRVYAVFDYQPQNADELQLTDGMPLTVIRKGDEVEREWWWTSGGDPPRDGYIPRNLLGLYPRVKPKSDREADA